ncbi:Hypothetical protein ING2D1G_0050 [Peptoniphilus sp. ING2-D1G]|nr:Hypothetical protein ING2D1G_0050 [Peptoniphilus sp. ING2-D1G]
MEDRGMYGIVDIGSNTIRFNIYSENKGKYRVVSSKKTFAGLSSYVEDNKMTETGIKKVIKILNKLKKTIDDLSIEKYYIFATAAIRNVDNSKYVLGRIRKETELDLTLLSGKMEGFCDFLGVKTDIDVKEGYILDIGGGSTEIILVKEGEYIDSISLPEGSLSLFKKNVSGITPTFKEYYSMKSQIFDLLNRYPIPIVATRNMYGVGGTIRAAGNISQELYLKDSNKNITLNEVEDLVLRFIKQDRKALEVILQVTPERIHTQVPGMVILIEVMKMFNIGEVEISKNGVREGYLYLKQKEIIYDGL